MRLRVVCATGDTMATLCPTRAFSSVDFPAFGRPTMATNPDLKLMHRDDSSRMRASPHEDFRWDMQCAPSGAQAGTGTSQDVAEADFSPGAGTNSRARKRRTFLWLASMT